MNGRRFCYERVSFVVVGHVALGLNKVTLLQKFPIRVRGEVLSQMAHDEKVAHSLRLYSIPTK